MLKIFQKSLINVSISIQFFLQKKSTSWSQKNYET